MAESLEKRMQVCFDKLMVTKGLKQSAVHGVLHGLSGINS
jgi:hypothetical protein